MKDLAKLLKPVAGHFSLNKRVILKEIRTAASHAFLGSGVGSLIEHKVYQRFEEQQRRTVVRELTARRKKKEEFGEIETLSLAFPRLV